MIRSWALRALFVVGVTFTGCGSRVDAEVAGQFQRAQQAFDQARSKDDFLRVAAMYQQIVNAAVKSGAVFYNQGNAFMRAGQRGRAIACYRQAQRYRPRDPHLEANLRFAMGPAAAPAPQPLIDYVLFWQDWLSYPEKMQLSLCCAALTFLLAFGALSGIHTSIWQRLAILALLMTLAASASAAYDWYRFERCEHGVITRDNLVARKGNSDSYEAAFTTSLAEGTEVLILEHRGAWVRIQLAGRQEGWVPRDDVVIY